MLNQARWLVLLVCVTALIAVGVEQRSKTTLVIGAIGTMACAAGILLDYFRTRQIRTLEAEISYHRRIEAFRRSRANQRRPA